MIKVDQESAKHTASALKAPERLDALRQTALLDSPPEDRFDRLTRLAAAAVNAPVALISLVTDDRQFFKSCYGLTGDLASVRGTPIEFSFCQHVVTLDQPLIISDARQHPLVKENPSITALGVVAYAGIPLVSDSGHVLGSVCVIDTKPREWTDREIGLLNDVAASVTSEIRLKTAKESAESANRAKDRFLAILSHELRAPISPALMIVATMADDKTLPEQVREDAAMATRNIHQQTRLIDDLLDVSRIENGKLSFKLESLDLHALLHETIAACAPDAAEKKIQISQSLKASRHSVQADPFRMRQVFLNLLKNAIKFTPVSGHVSISTELVANQTLRVIVSDTGIGIAADALPVIFQTFAQGPTSRNREFGGLGLGLAICKGIIEGHHGTITADSHGENQGSRFIVDIPTVRSTAAPRIVAPIQPDKSAKSVNILLVDDHEDTLRAMSRLLKKLEHHVVTANCVQGALKAADTQKFDLLISDLGLPDGTGLDLMKELLGRQPIRGIALTGYGTDEDHRKTREAGFCAHLTKPIDFRALEGAIRTISEDA